MVAAGLMTIGEARAELAQVSHSPAQPSQLDRIEAKLDALLQQTAAPDYRSTGID